MTTNEAELHRLTTAARKAVAPLVSTLASRFRKLDPVSPGRPFTDGKKPDHLNVPGDIGLYCWFHGDEVVYIGKATGRGGLRQRVVGQHLNPTYLKDKGTKEKSQLRLKIAKLEPGYGPGTALKFVENSLTFKFIAFRPEDDSLVLCLEADLVRAFGVPKYNRR